jgi:hypothetical protein
MSIAGATLMLDHRISMYDPLNVGSTTLALYEASWSGSGSPATILPNAHPTGVNYYTSYWAGGRQGWATLWAENASAWAPAFTYDYCANGCDEPHTSGQWTTLINDAALDHALSPPLPLMSATYLSTATANNGLNSIDIMAVNNTCLEPAILYACDWQSGPNPGLRRSAYNTWLSGSTAGITRQIWSYIACGNAGTCGNRTQGSNPYNYPNYNIDSYPAANRAQEWMTFFHNQTGELYYYTTCAWETGCFQGSGPGNPWTNQLAFGQNGDGTLLYPSTFKGVNYVTSAGGNALTTPLWIPSIRVKHIRDGMQDYEYLKVLTSAGQNMLVNTKIISWITNSYTYEYTGSGLQAARAGLGAAMHQLSYPAGILPPTNVKGTLQITK